LPQSLAAHTQPSSVTASDRSWAAQPSIELYAPIEELPREFARTLRLSLETGGRSAVIRLSPPELGNVKIQISVSGDRVIAHAEVEREDVRAMLEQSRPALDQHLHRAGLVLDRLVIEHSTHGKALDSWNATGNGQFPAHASWNGSNQGSGRHHAPTPGETGRSFSWNGSRDSASNSITPAGSIAPNGTSRRLDLRV